MKKLLTLSLFLLSLLILCSCNTTGSMIRETGTAINDRSAQTTGDLPVKEARGLVTDRDRDIVPEKPQLDIVEKHLTSGEQTDNNGEPLLAGPLDNDEADDFYSELPAIDTEYNETYINKTDIRIDEDNELEVRTAQPTEERISWILSEKKAPPIHLQLPWSTPKKLSENDKIEKKDIVKDPVNDTKKDIVTNSTIKEKTKDDVKEELKKETAEKKEKTVKAVTTSSTITPTLISNSNPGPDSTMNDNTNPAGNVSTKNSAPDPQEIKKTKTDTPGKTPRQQAFSRENSKLNYQIIETALIEEEIEDKNVDLSMMENTKINVLKNTEITAEEHKKLTISLEGGSWMIKKVSPPVLDLTARHLTSGNTIFEFMPQVPGTVQVSFLRYDKNSNTLYSQPYRIRIKSRRIFQVADEEKQETKQEKKAPKETEKDTNLEIADMFFAQRKYQEAKVYYTTALNEGNDSSEIVYKMGIIEKNDGNLSEAQTHFVKSLEDKENIFYNEALFEYISALKEKKEYQKALDTLYGAGIESELDKNNAEKLNMLLADIYYYMKNFAESSKNYRRFLDLYPDSLQLDRALFYLAYSLENYPVNPDYKEAYRIYKLLTGDFPESRYYNLGKNRMLYLARHYLKIQ